MQKAAHRSVNMEVFSRCNSSTIAFGIAIRESLDRRNARRKHARDKIANLLSQPKETEDVGNPTKMFENLSTLRLEYTQVVSEAETEVQQIIDKYKKDIFEILGDSRIVDDVIRLKTYDQFIREEHCDGSAWRTLLQEEPGVNVNDIAPGSTWLGRIQRAMNRKIQEQLPEEREHCRFRPLST